MIQTRLLAIVSRSDSHTSEHPPRCIRKYGKWFVAAVAAPQELSITTISVDDMACKHLVQRFRSEHADLFPADIPNRPATEFLDQCAVLFRCTTCSSIYNFGGSVSHGAGCPRSPPGAWSIESSAPAKRNTIVLVLRLLEVLELPQDVTLSRATEVLEDVRFLCLCGDPRYGGHFDFQGLVGSLTSQQHLRLNQACEAEPCHFRESRARRDQIKGPRKDTELRNTPLSSLEHSAYKRPRPARVGI